MAVETERLSPAQHLERRIAALDAEVERIRAEDGDPAEALGRYLVERFGIEAIVDAYRDFVEREEPFYVDDAWDEAFRTNGEGDARRPL